MLHQDLDANEDQHQTAGNLCLFLKAIAETIADPYAAERKHQRHAADDGNGTPAILTILDTNYKLKGTWIAKEAQAKEEK